jgi:hypothetical protein
MGLRPAHALLSRLRGRGDALPWLCLLVSAALLVASCSSSPESGATETVTAGETAATSETGESVAVPVDTFDPDVALSPEEYQQRLDRAARNVSRALERLSSATSFKAMVARSQRAEDIASAAAENVAGLAAPAEATDANSELAAALRQLAAGFRRTGAAIGSRSLCAPESVLVRLGRLEARETLRRAKQALRRDGGFRFDFALPSRVEPLDRSLPTGTLLVAGDRSGSGQWTITNGLARDAVVAVTRRGDKATLHSVYVAAHQEYTLTGVRDGIYSLYFTIGKDWNDAQRRFTRSCGFTRFADPFRFTTSATTYTIWTASLNPVAGGTATTSPVDPDSFPSIR